MICYGGLEGKVISFNIRTTKIRDMDAGIIVTIRNRYISEIKKRSNLVLVIVPLSYEEDYRTVHRVLEEICERIREVEGMENCVYKGTQEFEDSVVIYRIYLYCSPERKWDMWRAARSLLQEGLADAGISIPYSQMDVHVSGTHKTLELSLVTMTAGAYRVRTYKKSEKLLFDWTFAGVS